MVTDLQGAHPLHHPGTSSLDGLVALVTGAGGGIGQAIAKELAAVGAAVHLTDIETSLCERLATAILERGGRASVGPLDVSDSGSCAAAVSEVVGRYGRLDVLINSAGIMRRLTAAATSDEDWERVIDVNLHGTFRMCRTSLTHLEVSPRPAIVNLSSVNGAVAVHDAAAYCVSKAGVLHLTKVLALEWAQRGIRVNAVAPTIVATPMTEDLQSDPVYMQSKLASIPLGRMASAEEVAHAVVWLASPASSMITGSTIFVDGGYTIQ